MSKKRVYIEGLGYFEVKKLPKLPVPRHIMIGKRLLTVDPQTYLALWVLKYGTSESRAKLKKII